MTDLYKLDYNERRYLLFLLHSRLFDIEEHLAFLEGKFDSQDDYFIELRAKYDKEMKFLESVIDKFV